ncbi:energy-coupling factor transporter transmembrane component T [Bifidobacterium leontopitheci]|uniref:Cobalt ABC transporter permease n=1 Tax=Bifidobacterium leontopitheci TaxID=2650774 RepID=A0A6I1GG48_9BIFI|nr:energy-coupling factor transporter transmembrane component T [Bifidobacterium leontopitheci]KAB7790623.1 cobalt ABC transporter permease [Bifidobacterium leontopitheci]
MSSDGNTLAKGRREPASPGARDGLPGQSGRQEKTPGMTGVGNAAPAANATTAAGDVMPPAAHTASPVVASSFHPNRTLALDPRAKLYLLLAANLLLFFHVSTRAEALLVALCLVPLAVAGRWRAALRLGALYIVLLALGLWSGAASLSGSGSTGGASATATANAGAAAATTADALPVWLHVVGLFSVGLRMMMPCLITGAYAFTTTRVSEFVCAMRRMRVPESVTIPCMVVIRFFPTIARDYRSIRDAMALRGIASGRLGVLRHPVQTLEFVIVPLLMNATIVSRDLSAAALTKGLGLPGRHTSMIEIRMRWFDWAAMAVCTLPLALGIGGVL